MQPLVNLVTRDRKSHMLFPCCHSSYISVYWLWMFAVQTPSPLMCQNQDQDIVVASELHCTAQQLGLGISS